jgi:hypothetical protein
VSIVLVEDDGDQKELAGGCRERSKVWQTPSGCRKRGQQERREKKEGAERGERQKRRAVRDKVVEEKWALPVQGAANNVTRRIDKAGPPPPKSSTRNRSHLNK